MRCPSCRTDSDKVIDSRTTDGGRAIRRRRMCQECGRRFTTKERIEEELRLSVIKSDGSVVLYRREKVRDGVERACYKLAVTEEQITGVVDRVEEDLFREHDREVRSEEIGRYVARHLRGVNPVAYVRFMSVYRKYSSVEEFVDEIREIRERAVHDSPQQQALFE
ncbi:MAG: transcriptional repressor NrdR [Phycisphaerales bacterium]|nr:MAG: transcriptional repressor NrdR [Phycisphaerales bacterium]